VLVPDRPFLPSIMFVGKFGAFLYEAPFRCSTLGKGLPKTNTLAYLKTLISYECSKQAKVLVPDRPFEPSKIFVGKAGALPTFLCEAPFRCSTLKRCVPKTNTLACLKMLIVYEC
jgi:hypothetical protein